MAIRSQDDRTRVQVVITHERRCGIRLNTRFISFAVAAVAVLERFFAIAQATFAHLATMHSIQTDPLLGRIDDIADTSALHVPIFSTQIAALMTHRLIRIAHLAIVEPIQLIHAVRICRRIAFDASFDSNAAIVAYAPMANIAIFPIQFARSNELCTHFV